MHIPIFEQEGFEADDILGTLSALAEKNGIVPVVVSGDRDLLQLAGETLKVRIPKTKGGRHGNRGLLRGGCAGEIWRDTCRIY